MPKVVHFEIPSADLDKAADFYSKAFGWNIQRWGEENYMLASAGDKDEPGIDGAIYLKDWMTQVTITIGVPSLEKAIEKVKASGGEVVTEIREVPKVGRIAYFKDLDGNMSCMMQSFED